MTLLLTLPLIFARTLAPTTGSEDVAIIGGHDGPTAIFLSNEYSLPGLVFVVLIAGLLFWNAHVLGKERGCQQSAGERMR